MTPEIMTQELITISPIDGSVAVKRPYASTDDIQAALSRAKLAQRAWQSTPLATRAALVTSAVEALVAQKDVIAQQMRLLEKLRDTLLSRLMSCGVRVAA